MLIVRIMARVCAWAVDRTVSSTGASIVTGRAGRATAVAARGMRHVFRIMCRKTRKNTGATRVVVQVMVAAVRVMRRVLRLASQVIRLNTRDTRVAVRDTAAAARVTGNLILAVSKVVRVTTGATRRVARAMAVAVNRGVPLTIARAAVSESPPGPG
jgi:hypothetical protein